MSDIVSVDHAGASGVAFASERSGPGTRLPGAEPALRAALQAGRKRLAALYGERLRHVILYGSRARGEARSPDHPGGVSDIDVLVVLGGEGINVYQDARPAAQAEMELFERYRLPFSLVTCLEDEFEDTSRPFIRSVREEGIVLKGGRSAC